MKKQVRVISILLLMLLTISTIVGCSSKEKDEELIRTALTEELDSIKNLDEDFMKELEQGVGIEELGEMGIDASEFMGEYLKGFDYTIEDVTVEDKTAVANIVLKCKSYKEYQKRLEEVSESMFADTEALAQMTEEELQAKIGEILLTAISEVEVKETETISIDYELVDDTWTATDEAETKIASALFGN